MAMEQVGVKRIMRRWVVVFLWGVGCLMLAGVGSCRRTDVVWIYTSLPKETLSGLATVLEKKLPAGTELQWVQGGSETLAMKLNLDWNSGKNRADLLMASDPWLYQDLKREGRLLVYRSPAAQGVPAEFTDPDGMYSAFRLSWLVLAYHPQFVGSQEIPSQWKDLLLPKWKQKVSMPSPFDSPAGFAWVGLMSGNYGWSFFKQLKGNGLVAEGTSSSVVGRIETGERPIGVGLYESFLKARERKIPLRFSFPTDGTILIPGGIALLSESPQKEKAQRVYDALFSPEVQEFMNREGMISPLTLPSSEGRDSKEPLKDLAKAWVKDLPKEQKEALVFIHDKKGPNLWSRQELSRMEKSREQIRALFSDIIYHE